MIIRLFRSQYHIQYILLFLLILFLWGDAFIFPEKLMTGNSFHEFPWVSKFISSFPYVALGVSILLLFLQAVLLNAIAEKHKLVERNQLLTAAIYVVFMSSQPQLVQPNLMLLVNLLLILLLYAVLNLHGRNESLSALFDAGMLVGLATMLFLPSFAFMAFILITLMIFRLYRWREWVVPFIGLAAPWLFYATYLFWYDALQERFDMIISSIAFRIPDILAVSTELVVVWILIFVLIITGFGKIIKYANETTVDIRRKSGVVFWMLLIGLGSAFFSNHNLITQASLEFIPVTIFIAGYLSRARKMFIQQVVMFLILAAIIIIKLQNLL